MTSFAGCRRFSYERQRLFLTVQSVVLPKFGFEGSPQGSTLGRRSQLSVKMLTLSKSGVVDHAPFR